MTELADISNLDPEAYLDSLREGKFSVTMLRVIMKANFKRAEDCRRGAENCERIAQGVGDIINGRMIGGEKFMEETQNEVTPETEPDAETQEAPQTPQEAPEEGGLDNPENDS